MTEGHFINNTVVKNVGPVALPTLLAPELLLRKDICNIISIEAGPLLPLCTPYPPSPPPLISFSSRGDQIN